MKHTSQNIETIEENLERDKFLTPDEAKKFGIVDDVVVHRVVTDESDDQAEDSPA